MSLDYDKKIKMEPAPDLGEHKYRCNCGICTRSFIVDLAKKEHKNMAVICPTCSAARAPDWDDAKSGEEKL